MQSVPRKLTLGLILAMGVAACGDDVTVEEQPQPTPVVRSVVVSPASATIAAGGTFQFGASVDADAGLANTVTWTASGGTGITVDQNGLASASATATGTASICAASTANTAVKGCAQLAITPAAPPATVQIDAITVGCTPINTANPGFTGCGFLVPVAVNNVYGQIDVRGTVNRQNSGDVKAVRIEIFATDAAGNTVGAAEYTNKETLLTQEELGGSESIAAQGVGQNSITHSINTADYTLSPSNTAPTSAKPTFVNGQKKVRLTLLGANDVPLTTSSTSERTLSFRNANGFHVIVNTNLNSGNNANATCGATGAAACPVRVNALAGPTGGLAYNGGTPLDITALPVVYATGALHPNGFSGTLVQSAGTGVGFGSAACDLLGGGLGGGQRVQSNTGVTITIPAGTTGNIRGTLGYTNTNPTVASPAPAGTVTGYQMSPVCPAAAVGELPFGIGADATGNPLINFALGGFYTAFNTLNSPFGPVNATYPTAPAIRLDNGGPPPIFGYATGRNDAGVGGVVANADACFGLFLNAAQVTNAGFACAAPPLGLLVTGVAGGASINLNPQTAFVGSPAVPAGRTARLNGWINSAVAFNALSQTMVIAANLANVTAASQSSEGVVAPSPNATGLPLDLGVGNGVVGGNPVTLLGRVGTCSTVATCATAPVRTTGAGLAETSTGYALGAIVQSVDPFGNLTNPPAPGTAATPGGVNNFGTLPCPVTLPNALCLNNPNNPGEPLVAGGVLRIGYDNTTPVITSRGFPVTVPGTAGTTFTDNTIQGSAAANFDYQADDNVPAGLLGAAGILSQAPGSDLYVSMSRRDGATTQFFCQSSNNYQPSAVACPSPLGTGLGWGPGGTVYVRGAGTILTDPALSNVRAYYQAIVFTRDQAGNQTTATGTNGITAQTRDFIFDNTPPTYFGAAMNPGVIPATGSLTFTGSAVEDLDIGRAGFSIRYPSLTSAAGGFTAGFDVIRLPWANKPAGTGILTNPIGYTDPGPTQVNLATSLAFSAPWNQPMRSLEVVTAGDSPAGAGLGQMCVPVPPNGGFTCLAAAAGNIQFPGSLNATAWVNDIGTNAGGTTPTQFNYFAQSVSRVGLLTNVASPALIQGGTATAINFAQSGVIGQAHPCGGAVGFLTGPAWWTAAQGCGQFLPGGALNQFFNMGWAMVNPAAGAVDLNLGTSSKTLQAFAFGANGPFNAPFAGGVRFYMVDIRQPLNIDANFTAPNPAGAGIAIVEVCGPNTGTTVSIVNDQATNTWQYSCIWSPSGGTSGGSATSTLLTNDLAGFNFANANSLQVQYPAGIPIPGIFNAGYWGGGTQSNAAFGFNQGWQGLPATAGLAATTAPFFAVGCNAQGNCLATRMSTNANFSITP